MHKSKKMESKEEESKIKTLQPTIPNLEEFILLIKKESLTLLSVNLQSYKHNKKLNKFDFYFDIISVMKQECFLQKRKF